jgi:hypothetical protein
MRAKLIALSLVIAVYAGNAPARANVIFTPGNNPQANESNILFTTPSHGTTIDGEVGHSGTIVLFDSFTAGQFLVQKAQGQADIFGCALNTASCGPSDQTGISNIAISVPGHTFGDFILNLQNGLGQALVTAYTSSGSRLTYQYALTQGQNYLTLFTTSGERINRLQVTMSDGATFADFKQPRISDVVPIPEPATLLIFGAALLFLLLYSPRRRPMSLS